MKKTHDKIAEKAYYKYLDKGSKNGEELENWLEAEKEVINIVVPSDQVDRIFEKMYLAGKMDTPGMGFMWVTPLEKAATFVPPEVIKQYANGVVPDVDPSA